MDSLVSGETLKNLKGTKTEQNLKNAFAGESQARNKYTFYAEVAKDEGYEQIAAFFTETAGNEKEHAEMWYKLLHDGGLGTTKDNLKIAAFGETGESEDMYPDYAKIAKEEGLPEIAALFEGVAKIENGHSIRYSKLLNNLENNQVFEKKNPVVWECRNCGHRQVGKEAPDYCPVCGYPKIYFQMPCHNY